jgi:hypothetical protein
MIDAGGHGVEIDLIAPPDTQADAKLRLAGPRFVDISHNVPNEI